MKKIMVLVEDEQNIASILKEQFEQLGIEVESSLNGIMGMEKIRREKPDLVLLDLILPGKSGMEILREMREDQSLKDIPVIILSNINNSQTMKEAISLGVKDYLVKVDYELKDIIEIVKKYINKN